ncbi:MAG: cytochrome c peroxidase [Saprospiraceae bacterium]|jgi:cytochrome c peroxidase
MKNYYLVFISILCFFIFFAGTIDLNSLLNYSNQAIPGYINEDNTPGSNPITDEGATLGRVLFYDTNLSLTGTVSCSSCHKQAFAFGDSDIQSTGHGGGLTGRHSPRLSSARFGEEEKFFWDERAGSLEIQTTMPIQDHVEMGFSGNDGDPDIDSLIIKLTDIYYYNELFNLAFGDQTITEERMQNAMAQFVRSMQSFDSKYDIGRGQVGNNNANFPNFTTEENNGKALFMSNDDTGCNRCHRAPEFDIDPDSDNNGVIGVAGGGGLDLTNVRSPSLRDVVNSFGVENGPYMHDGSLSTLMDVINHYDDIPNNPSNTNLDNRLQGNGGDLNLTDTEKDELLAFLKTLGGSDLYTNEKWSNPFDANGNLEIINGILPVELSYFDARQEDETIKIEWETLVEINNDGFEILHSKNSKDWNILDFVFGNNESSKYQYIHFDPSIGANYYRLKQIDFDGKFELSDIRFVSIEEIKEEIMVYPNPTYGFVNISASTTYEIASIYDINGQLRKQVNLNGSARIDLSELERGAYFIRVSNTTGDDFEVSRIVKL